MIEVGIILNSILKQNNWKFKKYRNEIRKKKHFSLRNLLSVQPGYLYLTPYTPYTL